MKQMKLDLSGNGRVNRPHHRTTVLTTDRVHYDILARAKEGETVMIPFVNDIVSTTRGGVDADHHPIRRLALLRAQIGGGFRKVKVRSELGNDIPCLISAASGSDGDRMEDRCDPFAWVYKKGDR